jgi:hypothetical protein
MMVVDRRSGRWCAKKYVSARQNTCAYTACPNGPSAAKSATWGVGHPYLIYVHRHIGHMTPLFQPTLYQVRAYKRKLQCPHCLPNPDHAFGLPSFHYIAFYGADIGW